MPPRSSVRRARPRVAALLVAAALALSACAATASSFDPRGACVADGIAAGAYPDLEARIPTRFEDRAPSTLESGRHCTATSLGSLVADGFTEIRFAGGTWDFGGNRAAALVVFRAAGLTPEAIARFYTESARAADRTRVTGESSPTLAGHLVRRLDSRTGARIQAVVVWSATDPDVVNVVLTNDLPDPKIEAAVAAFDDP